MEFNEKLQQLRKNHNLTQEQLAEQLYVSRTAISKWESGRGYPNIESLKCISKLFSVTIDELLSSDELITLAETENRSNLKKIYMVISGIVDVLSVAFILLPIYGKPEGNHVYSVNLLANTHTPKLIFTYIEKELLYRFFTKISIAAGAAAICLFAAAREPYATILLFLFFGVKVFLLWKQMQADQH